MSSKSYAGPATLVVAMREEPVNVRLQGRMASDGLLEWDGQVYAADDGLLWDAMEADDVRLRVGAREAKVSVVNHSAGSRTAQLVGSGTAPF